ncbi:MAG: acyl-CoA thioesterase [Bacteroidaceae bacterium]|nr:acyl-CoA thioesterase [Bacteroidaceae bacterium]
MMELVAEKKIEIRFSEVDVMNVVWHGSYPLYFEDAREAFGAKFGLSYKRYMDERVFAPIVELDIKYKRPILYGMTPVVRIVYRPTEAAKIVFDYEIVDAETGTVFATAHSVQVFMDMNYNLMWDNPDFFVEWKKQWGIQHG